MIAMKVMVCLARGHNIRRISANGSLYRYCLRCGKTTWEHRHVERPQSKEMVAASP